MWIELTPKQLDKIKQFLKTCSLKAYDIEVYQSILNSLNNSTKIAPQQSKSVKKRLEIQTQPVEPIKQSTEVVKQTFVETTKEVTQNIPTAQKEKILKENGDGSYQKVREEKPKVELPDAPPPGKPQDRLKKPVEEPKKKYNISIDDHPDTIPEQKEIIQLKEEISEETYEEIPEETYEEENIVGESLDYQESSDEIMTHPVDPDSVPNLDNAGIFGVIDNRSKRLNNSEVPKVSSEIPEPQPTTVVEPPPVNIKKNFVPKQMTGTSNDYV